MFRLKAFLLCIVIINFFGIHEIHAQVRTNSAVTADNCRTIRIELQKNQKPTAETIVKASEVDKYRIKTSIQVNPNCPTGYQQVNYKIYAPTLDPRDNSNRVEKTAFLTQATQLTSSDFIQTYPIPAPELKRHEYAVVWKETLPFSGTFAFGTSIFVTYVDDKGATNTTPTVPDTTTTGTTPSTTPKPKPININTNVTATFNVNLDESIGYFFNPLDSSKALTLPQIITGIIRILFALIGIVAVVVIIVAGFRMVLAQGNETSLTKAKESITWAIIGLIVSLMAFSIVAILQRLIQFGAN